MEDVIFGIVVMVVFVGCLIIVLGIVELFSYGKFFGWFVVGVWIVCDDGGVIGFCYVLICLLVGFFEFFVFLGFFVMIVGLLSF